MRTFLYCLTFPNGKRYVGLSKDTVRRWAEHARAARAGSKLPVHAAIRKYGWDLVIKTVLCVGELADIREMEIALIDAFGCRTDGYNLSIGGDISPMLDPEVVRRASAASIGVSRGKGVKKSASHREKLRIRMLGTKQSPETCAKRSASAKASVKMLAHNIAQKGRRCDPGHGKNISEKLKGRPKSEAHKAKIREALETSEASKRHGARLTGSKFINNGITSTRLYVGDSIPEGWRLGRMPTKHPDATIH